MKPTYIHTGPDKLVSLVEKKYKCAKCKINVSPQNWFNHTTFLLCGKCHWEAEEKRYYFLYPMEKKRR